jgi:hypothetical protein
MDEDGLFGKIVIVTTLCALAIVGLVIGGWQAGWWFATQNANRSAHLAQHQYGRQISLLDDISTKLGTVQDITVQLGYPGADVQGLGAQRLAVAREVCHDVATLNTLTELTPDQQTWVQDNCSLGDVTPTSTLRPTGR